VDGTHKIGGILSTDWFFTYLGGAYVKVWLGVCNFPYPEKSFAAKTVLCN